MMEYKGYIAKVDIDPEARVFHGEVINLRDVITFEADCVDDLLQEFHISVVMREEKILRDRFLENLYYELIVSYTRIFL